jgi:hypothetical protein
MSGPEAGKSRVPWPTTTHGIGEQHDLVDQPVVEPPADQGATPPHLRLTAPQNRPYKA